MGIIFESDDDKYLSPDGFLNRLQHAWQQAGVPEPLKLSAPPVPTPSAPQEPAPLQIASGNPDAPAPVLADPDNQMWLDIRVPRDREVFTTAVGSGVISPTLHKLMQGAQSGDVALRFEFCRQLRILYENDYTVSTCIDSRIEGACRLGIKQEVVPIEGQENNPIAIQSADRGNNAHKHVMSLDSTAEREMSMREYILYGCLYDRFAWNAYGTIVNIMGLPAETIKILVNSQLRLDDGQLVAFQQFDPLMWGAPIFQLRDVQVLAVLNKKFRSDVYGSSFLLPIIGYAQSNIRTMDRVDKARGADMPITVQQREDAIGNGVHPSTLARAKWESLEQRVARGEDPGAHHTEWINGKGKVERLSSDGSYYGGFQDNDVKYRAQAISGVLGRSLAMILASENMVRANAEWQTESDDDRENKLAVLFADTRDNARMHRAAFITNLAAAAADNRWAMEPGRYYIDQRLIRLKSDIKGQVREDRAMSRATNALSAAGKTMSFKDACFVTAQAHKLDPDQFWQNVLRERPDLRKAYPEDWREPQPTLPPQINSGNDDTDNPDEQVM